MCNNNNNNLRETAALESSRLVRLQLHQSGSDSADGVNTRRKVNVLDGNVPVPSHMCCNPLFQNLLARQKSA